MLKLLNDLKRTTNILNYKVYDWSQVPSEVKWIATDEHEFAFGYRWKPTAGHLHRGFWYNGGSTDYVLFPDDNPFKGEWRDSLEERPYDEY